MSTPNHIAKKLNEREENDSLRELKTHHFKYDFFSNDYLGFAASKSITKETNSILAESDIQNGATGSRLISGNYSLIEKAEKQIAKFHQAESALLFNSGFLANLGVLSAIPQHGEIILFDELAHTSIREGIRLSNAKAYKFKHNDLTDLERLLKKFNEPKYVVIESVYSMDGDSPNKEQLITLCEKYKAYLIVDEAHAFGVQGKNGEGLYKITDYKLLLAKIITYGKALGTHGAAVLCDKKVQQYLINFSKPFIYTTAPPPHLVASIMAGYQKLYNSTRLHKLADNIDFFKTEINKNKLAQHFISSDSAIQSLLIGDVKKAKKIANQLHKKGFGVKEILSPTVPAGKERIRISLHSFNKKKEITELVKEIKKVV